MILYPTAPLINYDGRTLKPLLVRALKRTFTLYDRDMEDALSDAEFNELQLNCFNAPLRPAETEVLESVQEKQPGGVNNLGLTFDGFFFLHRLLIEEKCPETTLGIQRKFGCVDDLELRDDFLPVPTKHASDQNVELASEAVEFLRGVFALYDIDHEGAARPAELEDLFSTTPKCPSHEAPYKDAAETSTKDNLTPSGFLSKSALMRLLDPRRSLVNLFCIGYRNGPTL